MTVPPGKALPRLAAKRDWYTTIRLHLDITVTPVTQDKGLRAEDLVA